MRVGFFFDPACPWCWITSRWLLEVAPHRDLDIDWRPFSLDRKNRDADLPDGLRRRLVAGTRALRVIEAARVRHGDEVVGELYTRLGALVHHDDDRELAGMADAVAAAGVDVDLLDCADAERWDGLIEAGMAEALRLSGEDVGVPLLVLDDAAGRRAFFGPVFSPAPVGPVAVAAFDGLVALTAPSGFFELKRGRDVGPRFAERPDV